MFVTALLLNIALDLKQLLSLAGVKIIELTFELKFKKCVKLESISLVMLGLVDRVSIRFHVCVFWIWFRNDQVRYILYKIRFDLF